MRKLFLSFTIAWICFTARGQHLQPGFDGKEYLDMLSIAFQRYDSSIINPRIPPPADYSIAYQSPESGLRNRWNMWYRNDHAAAVISIRGTVGALASWLENFYAAMIPATGSLQLNDSTVFKYQLAADDRAAVHTGWVVGLASFAPDIVAHIKQAYRQGIREFIIAGHSQGGALAILTRSYLYYLTQNGQLPADIVFKTYGSAAPKTGNTYYAYDFDFITRGGWAFTIVNAADWVPETPFSVQQVSDFNAVNPFTDISKALKRQPWIVRMVLKCKYNKIKRSLHKSQRRLAKDLGSGVYKQIKKFLPQLKEPAYMPENNYQRLGACIVLQPDAAYYKLFPDSTDNIFQHHSFGAYRRLAAQYYGAGASAN